MENPKKELNLVYVDRYLIFWNYYIDIQKNKIPKYELLFKRNSLFIKKNNNASVKPYSLVIHNSQRQVGIGRIKKSICNYYKLTKKEEKPLSLVDTYHNSAFRIPELFVLAIKIVCNNILATLKDLINGKRMAEILLVRIQEFYFQENIDEIILFTENNRLTEIFRQAGIFSGLDITSFLHGTTSDAFGEYYEKLNKISELSNSRLFYINMAPGLPQPESCMKNIIKIDNKELFFQNEKIWADTNVSDVYDVMIIGGTYWSHDYESSEFFQNELAALNDCINLGLKVVYAPHPGLVNKIEKHLPRGIPIFLLWEKINSAKCVIGHYSTSLFISHLLGKKVLIFESAWKNIPENLQKIFVSTEDHTYMIEKLLNYQYQPIKNSISSINLED